MELFYDMFVPYMPDTTKDADGNMVHSDVVESGRKAMMELSEFQLTGNFMALYQAVISACKYAEVDLIDTVLDSFSDVTIDPDMTVGNLVDESAKMLFKSINPEKYPFDANKFTAYILMATHLIFLTLQQNSQKSKVEEDTEVDKDE